jgi:hypothetical protein
MDNNKPSIASFVLLRKTSDLERFIVPVPSGQLYDKVAKEYDAEYEISFPTMEEAEAYKERQDALESKGGWLP